jgi:hypothetical protein
MLPILARTSNHVKSLFLLARVRGLPQRIDVQPLLIQGFLLPGTREKLLSEVIKKVGDFLKL